MPSTGEVQVCPISVHTGGIEESVAGVSVAVEVGRGVAVLTSSGEGVCAGPQALNASTMKRWKRMEIRRFIGNPPLRNLFRFVRFTFYRHHHSVYRAAVIPEKRDLEIRYSQVKVVFGAC